MKIDEELIEFIVACNSDYLQAPIMFLNDRSNNALVIETRTHYLLQSYDTIIASINKETKVCVDALRYTYGYTRTSAKHVKKFIRDYGANEELTIVLGDKTNAKKKN